MTIAPAFGGPALTSADIPAATGSDQDIPRIAARILRMTQHERDRLKKISRYMRNQPDGVYVPRSARSEYHWLMKRSKVNFLPLIVSVIAENLHIDGYQASPSEDMQDDYTAARALAGAQDAIEAVGLEYTIVAVTCSFSQQGVAVRRRSGTRA